MGADKPFDNGTAGPAEHHDAEVHPKEHEQPLHTHHAKKSAVDDAAHTLERVFSRRHIICTLIYLAIALIMFFPITANITNVAPGSGGDTYLNLWDIWWVGYATFTLHSSIWSTSLLFWPIGANLAYQTMSPIGSLLSVPFQSISIPFAYNVLFFIGFALSGLMMFVLAEYLTGSQYAAFFAGLVFTFSAAHIPLAYSHIDWIFIGGIPIAIFFFLRMVRGHDRYWNAVGLAISMVLVTFMGDIEQAMMAVLALALILVVHAAFKESRQLTIDLRLWGAIAAAVVFTFILGVWGFLPIISTVTQGGLGSANYLNDIPHNMLWSDDLLSFFLPSYYNGLFNGIASKAYYGIYEADPAERASYIGYTVIILAVYGMMRNFKDTRLWVILGLVFGWMALGPYLQVGSSPSPINGTISSTGIPGIFLVYHALPVINFIREPDRFGIVFTVATAALAAYGLDTLLKDEGKKARKGIMGNPMALVALISFLFLLENNGAPLTASLQALVTTSVSTPSFFSEISTLQQNLTVLYLPTLPNQFSPDPDLYPGIATYSTATSHVPIIGGDTTRTTASENLSVLNLPLAVQATSYEEDGNFTYPTPINENLTNESLLSLYNYQVGFVVLDRRAYNSTAVIPLATYLENVFGAPIYIDNSIAAFSTYTAINNSAYRSFVSYPSFDCWGIQGALINGSATEIWVPDCLVPNSTSFAGSVVVYAPYSNTIDIPREVASSSLSTVNAMISFKALSLGASNLEVLQETQKGPVAIAVENLTQNLGNYTVNTIMLSGPAGNNFVFLSTGSATGSYQIAGVTDIAISKRD